jgi:hypothetical protein
MLSNCLDTFGTSCRVKQLALVGMGTNTCHLHKKDSVQISLSISSLILYRSLSIYLSLSPTSFSIALSPYISLYLLPHSLSLSLHVSLSFTTCRIKQEQLKFWYWVGDLVFRIGGFLLIASKSYILSLSLSLSLSHTHTHTLSVSLFFSLNFPRFAGDINSLTHSLPQTLCQSANVTEIATSSFPRKPVYPSDKMKVTCTVWISRAKTVAQILKRGRKIRHRDYVADHFCLWQSHRQIWQKCAGFWYFRVRHGECVSESDGKIRWWKRELSDWFGYSGSRPLRVA